MVRKANRPEALPCNPDCKQLKWKIKNNNCCLGLQVCSIFNLLVVASVAVVEMAAATTLPLPGSLLNAAPQYARNNTELQRCLASNLTRNFTALSRDLTVNLPVCTNFSWVDVFPATLPPQTNSSLNSTVAIDCNFIFDIEKKLIEIEKQFLEFVSVVSRSDCRDEYKYSMKKSCPDCLEAYKNWLCLMRLDFFENGQRIKPCLKDCYDVIRSCPSFQPDDSFSHGGHSTFDCPSSGDVLDGYTDYAASNCKSKRIH